MREKREINASLFRDPFTNNILVFSPRASRNKEKYIICFIASQKNERKERNKG